jgi:hypothetical protein
MIRAHYLTVPLFFAGLCVNVQACEREEYARLKESSRNELVDSYCDARLMAETQRSIGDAHAKAASEFTALGDLRRADAASKSRAAANATKQACQRVARDAADMLSKRFGQKSINCK